MFSADARDVEVTGARNRGELEAFVLGATGTDLAGSVGKLAGGDAEGFSSDSGVDVAGRLVVLLPSFSLFSFQRS